MDSAKATLLQAGGEAAAAAAHATAAQQADGAGGDVGQGDGAPAAGAAAAGQPDAEQACLHAAWVAALAQAGRLQEAAAALASMLDRFASVLPVEVSLPGSSGGSGGGSHEDGWTWPQLPGGGPTGGRSSSSSSTGRPSASARTVRYLQEARNALMAAARERGEHSVAQRVAALATLRGLPPDVGTYNGLLLGTLSHGDGLAAVLVSCQERRWAAGARN